MRVAALTGDLNLSSDCSLDGARPAGQIAVRTLRALGGSVFASASSTECYNRRASRAPATANGRHLLRLGRSRRRNLIQFTCRSTAATAEATGCCRRRRCSRCLARSRAALLVGANESREERKNHKGMTYFSLSSCSPPLQSYPSPPPPPDDPHVELALLLRFLAFACLQVDIRRGRCHEKWIEPLAASDVRRRPSSSAFHFSSVPQQQQQQRRWTSGRPEESNRALGRSSRPLGLDNTTASNKKGLCCQAAHFPFLACQQRLSQASLRGGRWRRAICSGEQWGEPPVCFATAPAVLLRRPELERLGVD